MPCQSHLEGQAGVLLNQAQLHKLFGDTHDGGVETAAALAQDDEGEVAGQQLLCRAESVGKGRRGLEGCVQGKGEAAAPCPG